jgi:D-glycerate 3-kinase
MKNIYSDREMHEVVLPLAKKITRKFKKGKSLIVGIQGGQGTGKTVLGAFLHAYLEGLDYTVQRFSIDDFYETDKKRLAISKKHKGNPFFEISRGMPGTHRVGFLKQTLARVKAGKNFEIPIFDKSLHNARGDVLKKTKKVKRRVDFLLFEGWCVGIPYVSSRVLKRICEDNDINLKKLDPKLIAHKAVLTQIKRYQSLWKYINYKVMLKPDSVKCHKEWRYWQEQELLAKKGEGMSKSRINSFVEPFLPFTYLCYEKIKPNVTVFVDKYHKFYELG